MRRNLPILGVAFVVFSIAASGCRPQQPFYSHQRGDVAQYMDAATQIEYPDIQAASLDEVTQAKPPLTLDNQKQESYWDLKLEEAIQIALSNGTVLRQLQAGQVGAFAPSDTLLRSVETNNQLLNTVYEPALSETGRGGVEAALAYFDAQFSSTLGWDRNDTPQNRNIISSTILQQDLGAFQAQIAQTNATGGQWAIRHNVDYSLSNAPFQIVPSAWQANVELEARQPLLRGAGVGFNRIAGPAGNASAPGVNNGVLLARLRVDQDLADFEANVRNYVNDVERAYWGLYYAYRRVDTARAGRDSGLQTWRNVRAKQEAGARGGSAQEEAQARQQYYQFEALVHQSLSDLYQSESALRYMIGLATSDGRLIRPADEPTTAMVEFDWYEVHNEALMRSPELRHEKWIIKQRELELIAAKNWLLPRLDGVARYRWLGLGDKLLVPNNHSSLTDNPDAPDPNSNAYGSLTSGKFQEWHLGVELSFPFGFRRELANVRNAELALIRERKILQEQELELSHLLANALRLLSEQHHLAQSHFNRRTGAMTEVRVLEEKYRAGAAEATLDIVLDAQRRLADADNAYYNALTEYNISIAGVHFRKGSLLEYNGVYLAEGPWPAKAYFDAARRAKARDAAHYLNYGFTMPKVLSEGPIDQHPASVRQASADLVIPGEGVLNPESAASQAGALPGQPERLPTPSPSDATLVPPSEPLPPAPRPREEKLPAAKPAELPGPAGQEKPAQPQAKVLRPPTKAGRYDLGAMDLTALADKPAATGAATASVQPTAFAQPATSETKGWTKMR